MNSPATAVSMSTCREDIRLIRFLGVNSGVERSSSWLVNMHCNIISAHSSKFLSSCGMRCLSDLSRRGFGAERTIVISDQIAVYCKGRFKHLVRGACVRSLSLKLRDLIMPVSLADLPRGVFLSILTFLRGADRSLETCKTKSRLMRASTRVARRVRHLPCMGTRSLSSVSTQNSSLYWSLFVDCDVEECSDLRPLELVSSCAGLSMLVRKHCDMEGVRKLTLLGHWAEFLCPPNLEVLLFRGSMPLAALSGLPTFLKELTLPPSFDTSIGMGVLPANLRRLTLGTRYNQVIEDGVLPPHLEYLDLGWSYDQPLPPLPVSLKRLVLSWMYSVALPALPDNLRLLRISGVYNRPLPIPITRLTSLVLGWSYNSSLVPIPSLISLELGFSFNLPLERGQLPAALERLKFGHCFDQNLNGLLPPKLVSLVLGRNYSQRLSELPESLRKMTVDPLFFLSPGLEPQVRDRRMHDWRLETQVLRLQSGNMPTDRLELGKAVDRFLYEPNSIDVCIGTP